MSQFEKKSVNNGNLAIWLNSLKLVEIPNAKPFKNLSFY